MTAAPASAGGSDRIAAEWIGADWGTSHLRVWAMDDNGRVRAEARSDDGMGKLSRHGCEPALLALIRHWLPGPAGSNGADPRSVEVIVCGMAGSRQGWIEAPYRAVPCAAVDGATVVAPCTDPRLRVRLVAGLCQDNPADVMRGEETQIAGFLAAEPGFDGVLCLPGSHSKWVRISAGEVVSFQTFMTGEIFAALATHTVLRHSLGVEVAEAETGAEDGAAFDEAVGDALSRPDRLAARLFSLRAGSLLHDTPTATLRARLSGALIGAELAAARPYWLGQNVVVIGAPGLTAHYARALATQGAEPRALHADDMTRAGLSAVRAAQRGRA